MAGTADPKVRLRVFNYLRTSGIQIGQANQVASRVVKAMAGTGKLPECAIAIAAAAISPNPTLDNMDETKSLALLEPKAEPFEAWPAKTGGISPKTPSSFSTGMRTAAPNIGGTTGKIGSPAPTGFSGPIGTGKTNFAIIEPVIFRREVSTQMGMKLSRTQLQTYVGEVGRTLR